MNQQEAFWKGSFGDEYHERNKNLLATNIAFFAEALATCDKLTSIIELGAGSGENLRALELLFPDSELWGVEINEKAAHKIPCGNVIVASLLDFKQPATCKPDLSFTKGVLIHIAAEDLVDAYARLYESSSKYILIAEYYAETPTEVKYRGHEGVLWKRDFGDDFEKLHDVELIDMGWSGKDHPNFPQDDIDWWLFSK